MRRPMCPLKSSDEWTPGIGVIVIDVDAGAAGDRTVERVWGRAEVQNSHESQVIS